MRYPRFDSVSGRGYPYVNREFAKSSVPETKSVTQHGGRMGQFGQELRREREVRGVSVDAVCAVTKVSLRHLQALEEGRLQELPGGVFRKGIVRSYLSAVGLDERVWMERYELNLRESGMAVSQDQDWAEFAENVHRNRAHDGQPTGFRWFGVALMVLVLLVCGWLSWKYVLRSRVTLNSQSLRSSWPVPSCFLLPPL